MADKDYSVRGRSFRTPKDYQAALRDRQKIYTLERKYTMLDKSGKEKLLELLKQGKIKFETLLGDDFREELVGKYRTEYPAVDKLSAEAAQKQKKKTNKTKKSQGKKKARKLEDFDEHMQRQIRYEMHQQEKKRRRLVMVCSLVAFACIGYVVFYYYLYERNTAQYERLASLKEEAVTGDQELKINYTRDEERELTVLEKYEKLYSQNKSLIGWIKIDDTNINYPVMQTVNNEYYLDHNYTQEYDKNGSIFLDKDCDIMNPGTNMIIYGHDMKSGKMFGSLDKYSSKEYYLQHPLIQFDTIYEEGVYQIMYVFRSRVYNEEDIVFKYYQFFEASTPQQFDSTMHEMAKLSLYDTGITATYGDKLITLSTCDQTEEDGRFVVVAKKVN